MNKTLSSVELALAIPVMTRRDKLLRLAHIVRHCGHPHLYIFNGIEYYETRDWDKLSHPQSAFAVAARDPILQDAGLKGDNVGAAHRFFELTRNELHEFSCDCGGGITSAEMADRIERIAAA